MTETIETIPNTKIGQIIKMIESLHVLGGESDRSGIAFAMGVKEGSAYAPISGGVTLGLVETVDKTVKVTKLGLEFLDSDDEQRRKLLGQFLSEHEPFSTILRALNQGPLSKEEFMRYLKAKMPAARTWKESTEKEMLKVVSNWCEYGNLIKYDSEASTYSRCG